MGFVQSPVWFLASQDDFKVDGQDFLGSIITNPLQLETPCLRASATGGTLGDVSISTDWNFGAETGLSMELGLWTAFLDVLKGDGSGLSVSSLHTVTLVDDPTHEDIINICNRPEIQKFMRPQSPIYGPVYMVNGLKIAKGCKSGPGYNRTNNMLATSGAGVLQDAASSGGLIEATGADEWQSLFSETDDIVIAYQLLKIKPKGWFKGIVIEAGGVGEEADRDGGVVEAEKDFVTEWDLKEMEGVYAREIGDAWVGVPGAR